ncbi:type II toxin-antitoxin system HicB family antitoxin [Lapidilactobacillus wuchangensis]|uniref:type II toxin-antitoxin system HicB family antitoxin n=1 Tax=Lapidilactobacillus wuchangensis TaxID=2486001 RepID=UPI000F773604|nr:type II toxin-antitoxin system HicB family antitoxin [Lapidilactobacillus wuchangensis]
MKTKDKIVVYAVILTKDNDENYPYTVSIPALDGLTEGKSVADALEMAEDYIGTFSLESDLPADDDSLPAVNTNQSASFVRVNVSDYQRRHDNSVIKKTLTIPNYLNELGNKQGINFSATLTEALKEKLGV